MGQCLGNTVPTELLYYQTKNRPYQCPLSVTDFHSGQWKHDQLIIHYNGSRTKIPNTPQKMQILGHKKSSFFCNTLHNIHTGTCWAVQYMKRTRMNMVLCVGYGSVCLCRRSVSVCDQSCELQGQRADEGSCFTGLRLQCLTAFPVYDIYRSVFKYLSPSIYDFKICDCTLVYPSVAVSPEMW